MASSDEAIDSVLARKYCESNEFQWCKHGVSSVDRYCIDLPSAQ